MLPGDKETLAASQVQLDLMEAMAESGKPVVLFDGQEVTLIFLMQKNILMQ